MNPNCPECKGFGMIPLREGDVDRPPAFTRCTCVIREDILANASQVMPGLLTALPVKRSPLVGKTVNNVWITAPERWFSSHLRHVAIRQSPVWVGRVVSDAELVTSWLATVALKGAEIFDADAFGVSTKFLTITDLVTPPDLVVVRMGIKVARNSACAEVLAEAVNLRKHEKKPTWIWDQPDNPLAPGHLFWSGEVSQVLSGFQTIRVGVTEQNLPVSFDTELKPSPIPREEETVSEGTPAAPAKAPRKTLRGPV